MEPQPQPRPSPALGDDLRPDVPAAASTIAFIAWVPGIVLLAGLVWLVVTHLSEEREFALLLARSRPWWLAVAALLQIATYFSVGETWRIPLRAAGYAFPHWRLARLSVLKLTFDQAVPTGGLSGTVFIVRRLRRLGVPADVLGATLLIVLVGYYLAYASAVVVALAVLWLYHDLNVVVASVATVFAVLAAALPLIFVWSVRRANLRVTSWVRRVRWLRDLQEEAAVVSLELLRHKRLFVGSTAGSFATMLLDTLTLAVCLLAVGTLPDPLTCFAALVMASVAATIGIMPGGLGTFEAGSVAVLTLTGTTAASALGATLLLRGFTFWLPMIPGLLLMRRSK